MTDATTTPNLLQRLIARALSLRLVRAFLRYQEKHGPVLADSITYRTLFSVFAGVFLGFAVAGIVLAGNPAAIDAIATAVGNVIPGLIGSDGDALIDTDDLVQPLTFSIAGILALVGLVFAGIGAISSLRVALRSIADQPDETTFFLLVLLRDLALAIAFGALLAASAVVTVLSTGALDVLFGWIGLGQRDPLRDAGARAVTILITFAIDTVVVAAMIRLLSGLRPPARTLWAGAVLGGVGLTVLQVLSGLFVGGASSNPLLASFGSLIALLIWFNLSSQVILIAGAYVATGVDEAENRVGAKYGARTIAELQLRRAQQRAADAAVAVATARDAVERERRADDPPAARDAETSG